MKLKGINPIEQHIEKVVVVLTGLVLLGVIAQQFLTQPNEVKVGSETVPPGQAYEPVVKAALALKGKLDSPNPPLPPELDVAGKDVKKELEKLISGSITPRRTIAPLGPSISLGGGQIKATDALFAEVKVPTPAPAVAASFWSTISSEETAAHPELSALLPKEQPYDRAFVSIESSVDAKAFVESLLADPDGAGPLEPMPQGWWREGIEAIVVEAERQKQKSDGTWESPVQLPAMIGRPLFVVAWNDGVKTTSDMQSQIVTARQQSGQILRPPFYKVLGTQEWVPPSSVASRPKGGSDALTLSQKQAELEKIRADLKNKKDELAQLPKPEEPKKPEPSKPNAPRPNQPPAPSQPPTRPPEPPKDPAKPGVANPTFLRTKLAADIKLLESKEKNLSDDIDRLTQRAAAPTAGLGAGDASLLSQDTVRFWIHDATVTPGDRYRYRLRLGINNPLFGRAQLLKDEQKKFADASIIRSDWSEWSSPVDVDRAEYFFVTSATPDKDSDTARASVELFKYYMGHYRKETTGMGIGDPLSGEIRLKNIAAVPAPANPAAPNNPPPGPDNRGPALPGGQVPPSGVPDPAAPAPIGFTPPSSVRVTLDGVILLDIAPIPGASGPRAFVAVLRDADGSIIIRNPETDRESPLYKRMEASAKSGG